MSNHELIQTTTSSPATAGRAKALRVVDYVASYIVYFLITMACLAILGGVARLLFFGLQLGWRFTSKLLF